MTAALRRFAAALARPVAFALAGALGLAMCSFGCGGAIRGLSPDVPESGPDRLRAVLDRLAAAPAREQWPIVLGLTPAPSRLWAWSPRDRHLLWQTEVETRVVPHVASRWVVTQEPEGIIVRRLGDGAIVTRIDDGGLVLQGADGEGDLAAVVLSSGGAIRARSSLIALRGGSVAWQLGAEQAFGEPAILGGMVFLPWAQQNLSVLDGATGAELARVRFTRGVIGHALAQENQIFFGQRGLSRLSERSGPSPDAPWMEPAPRALPGDPELWRDAYRPPPGPTSASSRVRLVWRAAAQGEGASLLDDTMYLVFYRLVFALPAQQEGVRWVAELPSDAVGATVERGALLIVDEQGRVHAIDRAEGRVSVAYETGLPATWAYVSEPTHEVGPSSAVGPLRDRLLAAVQHPDARLVPARAFALRLLASLPEPEATRDLIALCDDPALPAELRGAACEALVSRRNGMEHVLSALERHASYLRDTRAPPVGALARTAAAANERRAVPHLIAHLRDPQTRTEDLAPLAQALRTLGVPTAAEPLADFVRLYHAEPDGEGLGPALAAAIDAYVALAGPASQELLERWIGDPMSMEAVREAAQRALEALRGSPPRPAEPETATPEAASTGPESETTTPELPARMTAAIVRQVLAPIEGELRACLVQPNRTFPQARVVLAIEPSGVLHTVSVNPAELQACLEPLIRSRSFPATRSARRETIVHHVTR
jgi:hypothetical protein